MDRVRAVLVILFPICGSVVAGNRSGSVVRYLLDISYGGTVARAYQAVACISLCRIVLLVLSICDTRH